MRRKQICVKKAVKEVDFITGEESTVDQAAKRELRRLTVKTVG